jgi:hypothetical protein
LGGPPPSHFGDPELSPPRRPQVLNVADFDIDGIEGDAPHSEDFASETPTDEHDSNRAFGGSDYPDDIDLPSAADPTIASPPLGAAAGQIVAAELEDLSPVQLLERLALAMEHRRASSDSEPDEAPSQPMPGAEAAPPFAPEATEAEDASAETAWEREQAWENAQQTVAPAASLPTDSAEEVDHEVTASEPPVVILQRLPRFPGEEAAPVENRDEIAGAPQPLPMAMRPLDLDESTEEALPPDVAPMRHIGTDSVAASAEWSEDESEDFDEEGESDEESDVAEEGYSSLISVHHHAQAKQPFIRIEEPEFLDLQARPVVVFPGQEVRADARFASAPEALRPHRPFEAPAPEMPPAAPEAAIADDSAKRRFDAPPAGAAPIQPPASAPADPQDPEATEEAMRAALMTLQRMSGAV